MEKKKKLVVLTGAGMSAESGLSTFRDSDGLWNNYNVQDVASHEGWLRNPSLIISFYNGLRRQLISSRPNKGHLLLHEMERDYDMHIITQNVDDLHERAGSAHVLHLHGELMKMCSSRDPDDPRSIVRLSPERPDTAPEDRAADHSPLRPYIVFFGEAVPKIGEAAELMGEADIVAVIGTSLAVYPAAGLLNYAPPAVPVYLIDPRPARIRRDVTYIEQGAGEGVQTLWDMLRRGTAP